MTQIRSPLGKDTLTVAGTAVALTAANIPENTKSADITVEAGAIRFWTDGSTPTAAIGQPVAVGERFVLNSMNSIQKFLAIRQGSVSATLSISYFNEPGGSGLPRGPVASLSNLLGQVVGSSASGTADDGSNPVKVGGKYNLTPTAQADGARVDLQVTARGYPRVVLTDSGSTTEPAIAALADTVSATRNSIWAAASGMVYNNSSWDRIRSASASVLSAFTSLGASLVAPPGQWTVVHAPAANTKATASKTAGGAGVRHVCTGILATLVAGAAAPTAVTIDVAVRDGASGAGTILWQGQMSLPAVAGQSSPPIQLAGLNLVGSAATAMTIEFSAAAGANTVEAVSIAGYDAS